MLTPEGKITLIEKMIAVKELPKPVTVAISAKYPKATTKSAEEVTKVAGGKESVDYYEVVVVTAGKEDLRSEDRRRRHREGDRGEGRGEGREKGTSSPHS